MIYFHTHKKYVALSMFNTYIFFSAIMNYERSEKPEKCAFSPVLAYVALKHNILAIK